MKTIIKSTLLLVLLSSTCILSLTLHRETTQSKSQSQFKTFDFSLDPPYNSLIEYNYIPGENLYLLDPTVYEKNLPLTEINCDYPIGCPHYDAAKLRIASEEIDKKTAPTIKIKEAEGVLKTMKKEVLGNENFDLEAIKKDHKIYDAEWLVKNIKLTRILELEDLLKLYNDGKNKKEIKETKEVKKERKIDVNSDPNVTKTPIEGIPVTPGSNMGNNMPRKEGKSNDVNYDPLVTKTPIEGIPETPGSNMGSNMPRKDADPNTKEIKEENKELDCSKEENCGKTECKNSKVCATKKE